jgi:hypothetical protein
MVLEVTRTAIPIRKGRFQPSTHTPSDPAQTESAGSCLWAVKES